jgi:hypothetical protein
MAFSMKSFVMGIFVALFIGLVIGYGVSHQGVDKKELEQQISQLKGELNILQVQIEDKNEQIANLQAQIEELEALVSLVKRRIEIEADGEVLHYQEIYVWSKEEFSNITGNQKEFESNQIVQFNEMYNVNADNLRIEYDQEEGSTILNCDIYGTFSGSWYDFHWFLNPLGLDFINSGFMKTERELSWKGKINRVAITITLRFPFTINHCHAHVWPK